MTQPRRRAPSTAETDEPTIALAGRIGPADADGLSDCVCARVAAGERGSLACDVAAIEDPDMGTVDALARMALAARRLGCEVELRRARPDLRELLELAGLGTLAVDRLGQCGDEIDDGGLVEDDRGASSAQNARAPVRRRSAAAGD